MFQSVLLVSGHEFIGINAFLFVALILVCLLLGGIIKRFNFHYLPESGATMLFGLVCGAILNFTSDNEKSILEFEPNLVFFVILPPIILDAGYTLKRKDFFANIGTILLLAIVGTIINNIVFGYIMYGFAQIGWIPLDSSSPLECLLFGAVVSATDPVATLAMLGSKEVNAHPLLYSLVFGESVLNDAIAIVLYKTFEASVPDYDGTDATIPEAGSFTVSDLFKALFTFLGVSAGAVVVGVGVALACCFIFKRIDFSTMPVYEFTLVTLFAYSSYFLAEMMYLSGIMSLFFCSVCLAHYNYYNISTNAQIATQESFKSIAQICETFVFAYIGITAGLSIKTSHLEWSGGMIVLTIICALVARACNVYPLCGISNLRRRSKIPFLMQIPLWFAGLRGAVAFALALSFPEPHRKYVESATLMLVLFSTIVGGGFTLPLLKYTGMSRGSHGSGDGNQSGGSGNDQEFELLENNERDSSATEESKSESVSDHPNGASIVAGEPTGTPTPYRGWVAKFKQFDKNFMRVYFGGQQSARGVASGVIDQYGAPMDVPGYETVQQFVMLPSPGGPHDPEEVIVRHGPNAGAFVGTSQTRFVEAPLGEIPSAYTREHRGSLGRSGYGGQQPSYKQDEDELKTIFQTNQPRPVSSNIDVYPASSSSTAARSSLNQSHVYRPPTFSPPATAINSTASPVADDQPTGAVAISSSLPNNAGTPSALQHASDDLIDPEEL